ncbi:hypothetical protein [Mycolicibacterium sp.]|uniref:hypothetical protein n=1 Tax=Mycolicibacterium sp. TaxID=2320850 RepID=UPI0025FD348F|nr:hypothetical protein [Mycolicibacterium sp.]
MATRASEASVFDVAESVLTDAAAATFAVLADVAAALVSFEVTVAADVVELGAGVDAAGGLASLGFEFLTGAGWACGSVAGFDSLFGSVAGSVSGTSTTAVSLASVSAGVVGSVVLVEDPVVL